MFVVMHVKTRKLWNIAERYEALEEPAILSNVIHLLTSLPSQN